jgi:hypothetical protein
MTDTKQPEALRLAEEGMRMHTPNAPEYIISKELRSLHEVNQELLEALKAICDCPQFIDEATVPKAGIEAAPQQVIVIMSVALVRLRKAQAAIDKAEVTK